MAKYVVTCPICAKRYGLPPCEPADLVKRDFVCPNCRYSIPYTSLIKGLSAPAPMADNMVTQADPQMKTKIAGNNIQKTMLHVISDGNKYILSPGNYTLGRRSSDSTATIQLAPDPYMSRQHANLYVATVGGKIVSQIRNLKPSNPIFINNKPLAEKKVQTLMDGDRIQIGMTHIIYINTK